MPRKSFPLSFCKTHKCRLLVAATKADSAGGGIFALAIRANTDRDHFRQMREKSKVER